MLRYFCYPNNNVCATSWDICIYLIKQQPKGEPNIMRHRLHRIVGNKENRSSLLPKSRTKQQSSFTFTNIINKCRNPHSTKVDNTNKLHSKSTYFYGDSGSSSNEISSDSGCMNTLFLGPRRSNPSLRVSRACPRRSSGSSRKH